MRIKSMFLFDWPLLSNSPSNNYGFSTKCCFFITLFTLDRSSMLNRCSLDSPTRSTTAAPQAPRKGVHATICDTLAPPGRPNSNANRIQIWPKSVPSWIKIEVKLDKNRTQIGPKSKLNRTQIDPKSNPNLTHIDPKSNPNRIHTGPKSSPHNTLLGCFATVIWQNNDVGTFSYIWYSTICCMFVQLLGFPVLETTICICVSWKCSKGPKCK